MSDGEENVHNNYIFRLYLGLTQVTRFRSYHGYHAQEPSQSLQTGSFDPAFRIEFDVIDGCPSVQSEPKDVELFLSSATRDHRFGVRGGERSDVRWRDRSG